MIQNNSTKYINCPKELLVRATDRSKESKSYIKSEMVVTFVNKLQYIIYELYNSEENDLSINVWYVMKQNIKKAMKETIEYIDQKYDIVEFEKEVVEDYIEYQQYEHNNPHDESNQELHFVINGQRTSLDLIGDAFESVINIFQHYDNGIRGILWK